jgi:hypothetical protein
MPQPIARDFRVAELVIHDDATPRAIFAEFLNNLTEDEEAAVLAFVTGPEFPLFAVCREIDPDQPYDELGAVS